MTKVEKETLLALAKLGKKGGSEDEVTRWRLYERYKDYKRWKGVKPGEVRKGMTVKEFSQYRAATRKWLLSFCGRGMAIQFYEETRMGKHPLHVGPFYKITEDGKELVEACRSSS